MVFKIPSIANSLCGTLELKYYILIFSYIVAFCREKVSLED